MQNLAVRHRTPGSQALSASSDGEPRRRVCPPLKSREQLDSPRGSSVKLGTIQRRFARPPRKDDTRKSRSADNLRAVAREVQKSRSADNLRTEIEKCRQFTRRGTKRFSKQSPRRRSEASQSWVQSLWSTEDIIKRCESRYG